MALSTQTTIETSCSVNRIKIYGDKNKDGVIDSNILEKAISNAEGIIEGYLFERYGSQITSADSTTSKLLTSLSDDISIYMLATTNQAVSIPIDLRYKAAMNFLEMLRDYKLSIPEFSDGDRWETVTEDLEFTEVTVDESPYYPVFDDFSDKVPIVIVS